jgi:hypothetical protein
VGEVVAKSSALSRYLRGYTDENHVKLRIAGDRPKFEADAT